jgi:hypothetical protein
MCGGCTVATAFSRDPSTRFRCSIELHPAIHCYHAKPSALSGPFAIRGLPFFPREGSQRGSRHRCWCREGRAFGKPAPRNDRDQRLARRDAPRKYTFRHLPPFAICEDASVRDDWIVEPNIPYCFKITTSRRLLGPRRERTRGWRGHGSEVALPFGDEGWFERPA